MTDPGCAGVDQGDGYDCYGQPVFGSSSVVPFFSGPQLAVMYGKLKSGAPLTLAEQVAIRSGILGAEAAEMLAARSGGAQPLPTVNVTADRGLLILVLLVVALILWRRR